MREIRPHLARPGVGRVLTAVTLALWLLVLLLLVGDVAEAASPL
jgi:hypothetical protein